MSYNSEALDNYSPNGSYMDDYVNILKENREGILNYEYAMSVMPKEASIRTVAIADMFGDEKPELMFITLTSPDTEYSEINLYTIKEGKPYKVDLSDARFDNTSGFDYLNLFKTNRKYLWWSTVIKSKDEEKSICRRIFMDIDSEDINVDVMEVNSKNFYDFLDIGMTYNGTKVEGYPLDTNMPGFGDYSNRYDFDSDSNSISAGHSYNRPFDTYEFSGIGVFVCPGDYWEKEYIVSTSYQNISIPEPVTVYDDAFVTDNKNVKDKNVRLPYINEDRN